MIKDTNPDHYKVDNANFIEYIDDPKISGFGNWMFANGFNSGVWASTNWISVKDRLPETNDEVLTTYLYDNEPGKRYVETASYFDDGEGEGHWHSVWDDFSIGRVRKTTIAWMPMPKPYKPPKED